MVDTVRIGGIKLSGELVQIDFREPLAPDKKLVGLLQRIVSAEVNIPHLHQSGGGDAIQTTLCINAEDFSCLQTDIVADLDKEWVKIRPSTGTVSLFPHGFDISFAAKIIHVLAKRYIPIHGISTSVSALVIHTDFSLLDDAVEQILTVCHLPENHTPLRPVVVLGDEEIETVAVYWEPKVRIYGMEVHHNLVDLQLKSSLGVCQRDEWCEQSLLNSRFRLLTQQVLAQDQVLLSFLIESGREEGLVDVLTRIQNCHTESFFEMRQGLEMVSFHGPHFQDRYGIAAMAFSKLLHDDVKLRRSGFTGTSVHFVVDEGRGKEVRQSLADTFVVP